MPAPTPTVLFSFTPPGPAFPISEDCAMPTIQAVATVQNVPDSKGPSQYQWKVTLEYVGANCAHSLNRTTYHPEINATTSSNTFRIPFTRVRGGALTVSVTVRIGNTVVTATSKNLRVPGTNPSAAALFKMNIQTDAFKRLMRLESGLRQFRAPDCPLFSSDNFGGVGICQITSPAPTDDQVWSWRENLQAGVALYRSKEKIARGYPNHVRHSATFTALVKAYNDKRVASSKPGAPVGPLTVSLPDYTDEQLQRDTIRGFNGFAGGVHQYRVKLDANGILAVLEDPGTGRGLAQWEEMTRQQRIAEYDKLNIPSNKRGDPGYVDDVFKQASF